jgi:hypothetical protein
MLPTSGGQIGFCVGLEPSAREVSFDRVTGRRSSLSFAVKSLSPQNLSLLLKAADPTFYSADQAIRSQLRFSALSSYESVSSLAR